jgi:phage terminase large subunit-like protein
MRAKFTYQNRLPVNYVHRVLARLLPSAHEIANLSHQQLLDLAIYKEELERLIIADPVRFFQPTPGGQWDFLTCADPTVQGLYFFAGNKTGKTTAAAVLVSENASGQPLWNRDTRTPRDLLLGGRAPIRVCCFSEDFSTHEETIIPTLLTWTPRSSLKPQYITRGPSGNITKILYSSGSEVYFRTYDQGYAKAEGKDYDLVWCDEPPPRPIYTAVFRGLVTTRGVLVIAATLLSEVWLYDEKDQPFVRVFEGEIHQNSWLDKAAVANFESMLDEDESNVRIHGKPSSLSGLIYEGFKDSPPFVVPYIRCPWATETPRGTIFNPVWPTVLGVDPHERRPVYCEWGYVTPDNGILWYDWALVPPGPLSEIFKKITEIERTHLSPTSLVIIDPNRGTATQIDQRCWVDEFESRDYPVLLGIDDIDFGHNEVRDMIFADPPRMRWMETCRGGSVRSASVTSPIQQMLHYTYQDWSRRLQHERPKKERPADKFKDFPDIHRYTAAAHLDFNTLVGRANLVIDIKKDAKSGRHIYY